MRVLTTQFRAVNAGDTILLSTRATATQERVGQSRLWISEDQTAYRVLRVSCLNEDVTLTYQHGDQELEVTAGARVQIQVVEL